MVSILPMPAFRLSGKGYDFSGINNAFNNVRQQNNQNVNRMLQQEQHEDSQDLALERMDNAENHRNALLEMQRKKMAQASQPGKPAFGKTGAVFQGPDGGFYSMQFANDGTRSIKPVTIDGKPLRPAKGVKMIDDGTGTRVIDSSTGQDVRRVAKDISGGERAKKIGQHEGKLVAGHSKAISSFLSKGAKNENLTQTIKDTLKGVNWSTTGIIGSVVSQIPGTPAHDFQNRLATIKANIGFDQLQNMRDNSPTGGALGQVSEMENKLLQATWASVEQSQSPTELRRNLKKLGMVYGRSMKRLREAYKRDYGSYPTSGLTSSPTQGAQTAAPAASRAQSILDKYGVK